MKKKWHYNWSCRIKRKKRLHRELIGQPNYIMFSVIYCIHILSPLIVLYLIWKQFHQLEWNPFSRLSIIWVTTPYSFRDVNVTQERNLSSFVNALPRLLFSLTSVWYLQSTYQMLPSCMVTPKFFSFVIAASGLLMIDLAVT